MKKKKWANSLFVSMAIVGLFLSFPLASYISDNPNSVIGKIVFVIANITGRFSGMDDSYAIAYGACTLLFLTNVLIWAIFLKPIETLGKDFWKYFLITSKERQGISQKVEETLAEEEKEGRRSYVYAGFAIIVMVGIILIGVQEIFVKGAVGMGLLHIIMGLAGGPYAIKLFLNRREKGKG